MSDVGVFSKNEVDFGSRLLIEQFEVPDISGDILDLGCGYGPIGIVLADQYPDRSVTMVDINERALELASENELKNRVGEDEVSQSDRFYGLGNGTLSEIL